MTRFCSGFDWHKTSPHCTRYALAAVGFAATALGSIGDAMAGPIDPPTGARIVELMQKYGQPDRVDATSRGSRAYHWRLKATATFEAADRGERLDDFFCNVTAVVGPGGKVRSFRAEPENVGAGVLASAGAFGPLCRQSFGLKPSRMRHETSSPMRR